MKAGSLYPFLLFNLDGPNLSIIYFATKLVAFYPNLPTFCSFFLASWMPGCRRNLDSDVVVVFLTDNNTNPTKVGSSCFGLFVGLWQYNIIYKPENSNRRYKKQMQMNEWSFYHFPETP